MNRRQIIANLKGIFPPAVTPFDRYGDVDFGAFRRNLQAYLGIGFGGVVVCGSSGEAPYLTERERLRLVETARAVVRPPEVLIVGTGLESTRQTVRLSRQAVRCGADALLVVTPNYYKPKMNFETLVRHYRAVADALPRPVIIYSIPQFTGVQVDADTIATLSRHPNIAGLKESSGDLRILRRVVREARQGFRVLVGSVSILLEALQVGAAGAVLSQAGFAPDLCIGVYESFRQGRLKTAREFQQRLRPLAQQITLPYGISGIKAALDLCGYAGGLPRPPLLPLTPAQKKSVAAALRETRRGLEV